MDLLQKANKLGYKHYTDFTIEELDELSLSNDNKQIEYYFIQKWLREEHNIMLEINYSDCEWWQWVIIHEESNTHIFGTNKTDDIDLTYEEALEEGLKQSLLLIK